MKSLLRQAYVFVVLVFLLLLGMEGISFARVIFVNAEGTGDYPTIQTAIDDANDGDEIIVSMGTYYETINFGGKNIVLRSTEPADPCVAAGTIIDGSNCVPWESESVVTFSGEESPSCVLSGFTITNGGCSAVGGGILGYGTLATIKHNIISNNSVSGLGSFGGGLYDCDGIIRNNIISKNTAEGYEGSSLGGGLYNCDGIIYNNIISHNRTVGNIWSTSEGGGLYNCNGYILNNVIVDNYSIYYGGGLSSCNAIIENCIIRGNTAGIDGDQIALSHYLVTPYGRTYSPSILRISYSNVEGGLPAIRIETDCSVIWGPGNIDVDPCFVDPYNGDYHLKSEGWRWDSERRRWDYDEVTSRCIDAGNPGSALHDELMSVPDDPCNIWGENIRRNMGAFGGTTEASMPPYDWALLSDMTNDGAVDFIDFGHMAGMFADQNDALPGDFDRDGDVDTADLGWLTDDWLLQTIWFEP